MRNYYINARNMFLSLCSGRIAPPTKGGVLFYIYFPSLGTVQISFFGRLPRPKNWLPAKVKEKTKIPVVSVSGLCTDINLFSLIN